MSRFAIALSLAVAVAMPAAPAQAQNAVTSLVPTCMFAGSLEPGQTIEKSCLAANVFFSDATVHHFVKQDSIRVYDARDRLVTGADRDTYIGFFRMSASTQKILAAGNHSNGEWDDRDVAPLARTYRSVCVSRRLTELTGSESDIDGTACRVGRVRAIGTLYPQREYIVALTMLDEGDQSQFAGWGLGFDEVQRYRTPALSDCAYWSCGPGRLDLYER